MNKYFILSLFFDILVIERLGDVMSKIVLVDGNNLLFRSYYATAYSGNIMRNKDGFPTNGLYGFVNMINKIVYEEKPQYMMVAFDVGKTFRHEKYADYKGGRKETPDELKMQFPIAKEILTAMGIKYLECPGYEADDIIGTISKWTENDDNFEALIVSSDKDLLQLISKETVVKLLRSKDYIMMTESVFKETYGFEPIRMIDLKALMGDASDNIPGVKGIGEKGAIKLLSEYKSLDNVYNNIDNIAGALHDKLVLGKNDAYYSKELVTIFRDVPLDVSFDDLLYKECDNNKLKQIYSNLGFYSLLKKMDTGDIVHNDIDKFEIVKDPKKVVLKEDTAIYVDATPGNYHNAEILGVALYNNDYGYYIPLEVFNGDFRLLKSDKIKYTYDLKKICVLFNKYGINFNSIIFDTMICAYLVNYDVKDDICYLANSVEYNIPISDRKENITVEETFKRATLKAKFIYDTKDMFYNKIKEEDMANLFNNIEMPLAKILADMESTGIRVDKNVLMEMGTEMKIKIELLTKDIYNYAGCEFNINSPKQLGEILFEKLNLPHDKVKKNRNGYSTDADVLKKLEEYPIVKCILEYRALSKLYSTYVEGMINVIKEDGKIHTIYTQTLTRTGRLSSIEPNLQNIPMRSEYGRLIRKAFLPENDSVILSSDYSQIELRVFAHLSGVKELMEAFNNNIDIHTKTAMDIFNVPAEGVTKNMRRQAKAVNFGILYGISNYGLASDLNIPVKEAKAFMEKYFETYPGVKDYMNKEIEVAKTNGYVKTIMNRKRNIEELKSSNYAIRSMGERIALNTPVQGSASDILKKAMVDIDRIFKEKKIKSKMLLQVHDELIFNVYNEEVDIVKEIIYNTMNNVVKLNVPLDVDIETGNNWYEAK